ncbi:MAG: AAA family ATPase, partial [Acidimicrobiales bacterium]
MGDFVGRCDELAVLRAELEAVRAGRPRVVVVEGAAGIGKSTLLSRFVADHPDLRMLRASGDEDERLVAGGVVDQLGGSAGSTFAGGVSGLGLSQLADAGPVAVGAWLVTLLGDLQVVDGVVAVVVDDLHWSDLPSAGALLFALRRMRADSVLAVLSVRPGEFDRLGDSWARFVSGDDRVVRVRLGGLSVGEVVALARTLGVHDLPVGAAAQLLEHTDGNPLHCRALLEELGSSALARAGASLPAPRALAGTVLARLGALSGPTQALLSAAAVLGRRWPLATAAGVAGLADPRHAVDEALTAGLVVHQDLGPGAVMAFAHPLIHAAVRDDVGAARSRRLHQSAATLVPAPGNLTHRVAAAVGPDDELADDLERAARDALAAGQTSQAAAWLVQAANASSDRSNGERRLLDAFGELVHCGDVTGASLLWPTVAELPPSARRSALAGHLDLLRGNGGVIEARLVEAWRAHDRRTEAAVGCAAATSLAAYMCVAGRPGEAVAWAERAVAVAADPIARVHALNQAALGLTLAGRGAEGLDRLSWLPADGSEAALAHTDALIIRGMCRLFTDDPAGAVGDLSVGAARLRAGLSLRWA